MQAIGDKRSGDGAFCNQNLGFSSWLLPIIDFGDNLALMAGGVSARFVLEMPFF